MKDHPTVFETLQAQGVSRRQFMKFCAATASSLALAGNAAKAFAQALAAAPRPSVIWMSFQQCTGCSESLLRSFSPTLENLILNVISLDYHESLQVAAGHQAEQARADAIAANRARRAKHILIVDGSIPVSRQTATGALDGKEWWMTVGGHSAVESLKATMVDAEIVIALGTCATFGGLAAAYPNPSNAVGVGDLMAAKIVPTMPLVNLSGCPPVPEVITGTIAAYLARKVDTTLPALEFDDLNRPKVFYGNTVHDACPRKEHFDADPPRFAYSHDDEGARKGWCLYMLGCRGPSTFNACSKEKWNGGQSFPMLSGHGCLGCSEPAFWDRTSNGDGTFSGSFYT
jgi:hydrogenase small subunit